jgi:hypothetical protein
MSDNDFQILGSVFRLWIKVEYPNEIYVRRRCRHRINLLKSVAGVSSGEHPSCMLLLYRGLIGSVLEYGSVCYAGMARTHVLLLERIQYRALRISMGLMGSTPNTQFRGSEWSPTTATQIVLS